MKSVTVELRYPGRTVEEVRAMLADPEFRLAVCTYQAVEDSAVTIEEYDDGSMTVDLDRTYGTDARPVVRPEVRRRHHRPGAAGGVDLPDRGDVRGHHPRQAGRDERHGDLVQSGPDAVETVTMDVRVAVPLVGGKLEDLVAGLLKDAFRAENKVGVKWLAGEWRV